MSLNKWEQQRWENMQADLKRRQMAEYGEMRRAEERERVRLRREQQAEIDNATDAVEKLRLKVKYFGLPNPYEKEYVPTDYGNAFGQNPAGFTPHFWKRDFWRVYPMLNFWPLDFVLNVVLKPVVALFLYGLIAFFCWVLWIGFVGPW